MYKKLADFIVENRTCSIWTIKSSDFIGRQNRPIFAWQTADICWPILLADKIGQLCWSSDIHSLYTRMLLYSAHISQCCIPVYFVLLLQLMGEQIVWTNKERGHHLAVYALATVNFSEQNPCQYTQSVWRECQNANNCTKDASLPPSGIWLNNFQ